MNERAVTFECGGDALVGIFHPATAPAKDLGVVIVVGGGPQYRVGGHRQLVLWSRRLAAAGYPVLRFDYRGMGDSHGEFRGFEDCGVDIRAAVDCLFARQPDLRKVVLWGECDASSAILFYAHLDPRVHAIALLNPWVRTEASEAKAVLRHYYVSRLLERSFWIKVVTLRFDVAASLRSAMSMIRQSISGSSRSPVVPGTAGATMQQAARSEPLPDRLLTGYASFRGPVLLFLSGRDLIAREFADLVAGSRAWQKVMAEKPTTRHDIPGADHTFSSAEQRNEVIETGLDWLARLPPR